MIEIRFERWRRFRAEFDEKTVQHWLSQLAHRSRLHFRTSMTASKGGKTYHHKLRWVRRRIVPVGPRGAVHTASAPGDFPAVETGQLKSGVQTEVTFRSMTLGSTAPYAKYLLGTPGGLIAKRKMSKEAYLETRRAMPPMKFARWRHG